MSGSLNPTVQTKTAGAEVQPSVIGAIAVDHLCVSDQLVAAARAEQSVNFSDRPRNKTLTIELSVIVPMFNEAKRIEKSLEKLASSTLNRAGIEFVFVDDGSCDDTLVTVAGAVSRLGFAHPPRIESLGRNRGKGAAVKAGLVSSLPRKSAYAAYIDADLSLNPEILDTMLDRLRTESADLIVGHRVVNLDRQPKLRRMMSVTFSSITSWLAPTGIQDTQCACKIFTAETVRNIIEPMVTEGFAFDVEILLRAKALKLAIIEHPVHWRHSDGSSVNQLTAPVLMVRDVIRARRLIARGE